FGAVEAELIALQQELQRVRGREHARDALRAARTWEEPDLDLGEPEAGLRIVGSDTVMAGECQLEAAAHCGSVQRRDPRLPAGLELAIDQAQAAREVEHH